MGRKYGYIFFLTDTNKKEKVMRVKKLLQGLMI